MVCLSGKGFVVVWVVGEERDSIPRPPSDVTCFVLRAHTARCRSIEVYVEWLVWAVSIRANQDKYDQCINPNHALQPQRIRPKGAPVRPLLLQPRASSLR